MGIETIAAIATIASSAFGVASATGLIGGHQHAPTPPKPELPAQPANNAARNDTASQVVLGADNVRNQRVSGSTTNGGTSAQSTTTADILGGLGAGGINI